MTSGTSRFSTPTSSSDLMARLGRQDGSSVTADCGVGRTAAGTREPWRLGQFRCRRCCCRVPCLLMNADEHRDLRKLLELLERAKRWEELTGNPSDRWQ